MPVETCTTPADKIPRENPCRSTHAPAGLRGLDLLVDLKLRAEVKMDSSLVKLELLLEKGMIESLVKLRFLLEGKMFEPLVNLDLKHVEEKKSPQVDSPMFLLRMTNEG
jgi:hypothetical protein